MLETNQLKIPNIDLNDTHILNTIGSHQCPKLSKDT